MIETIPPSEPDQEFRFNMPWPRNKNRRTPGPLNPDEEGPVVDDFVVEEGEWFYEGGTVPKISRGIKLKPPLDKAEVGTAWNNHEQT